MQKSGKKFPLCFILLLTFYYAAGSCQYTLLKVVAQ
jgi:hypothetical protein